MQPSIERNRLESRVDDLLDRLRTAGANLAVESGREAVAQGVGPFRRRGVLVEESGRLRVRDRAVLRYLRPHHPAPPRPTGRGLALTGAPASHKWLSLVPIHLVAHH